MNLDRPVQKYHDDSFAIEVHLSADRYLHKGDNFNVGDNIILTELSPLKLDPYA